MPSTGKMITTGTSCFFSIFSQRAVAPKPTRITTRHAPPKFGRGLAGWIREIQPATPFQTSANQTELPEDGRGASGWRGVWACLLVGSERSNQQGLAEIRGGLPGWIREIQPGWMVYLARCEDSARWLFI